MALQQSQQPATPTSPGVFNFAAKRTSGAKDQPATRLRDLAAGRIQLHLIYSKRDEHFNVTVIQAQDIPLALNQADCALSAKVQLLSDKTRASRRKTRSRARSCNPIWSDILPPWRMSKESLMQDVLRVQVLADSSTLCEAYIPLGRQDLLNRGSTGWFPLLPYRDRASSGWRSVRKPQPSASGRLLSWLHEDERLSDTRISLEIKALESTLARLNAYRSQSWGDIISMMDRLEGRQRQLAEAIWEVFTSELVHLQNVSLLGDSFLPLLERIKAAATSDLRLEGMAWSEIDTERLFGKIEALRNASLLLAELLEANLTICMSSTWEPSSCISTLVAAFEMTQDAILKSDLDYRSNFPHAREYFKTLAEAADFRTFTQWCEEDERCGRMTFRDLIVQPLQRLTRYPLLLRAILKYEDQFPGTNLPSYVDCLAAEVERQNSLVCRQQSEDRLDYLQHALNFPALSDFDGSAMIPETYKSKMTNQLKANLATSHLSSDDKASSPNNRRTMVFESRLQRINAAGRAIDVVHAYLLSDVLLLTRQSAARKTTKGDLEGLSTQRSSGTRRLVLFERPLQRHEIEMHNIPDSETTTNSFLLTVLDVFGMPNQLFSFRCADRKDKQAWFHHISMDCADLNSSRSSLCSAGSGSADDMGSAGRPTPFETKLAPIPDEGLPEFQKRGSLQLEELVLSFDPTFDEEDEETHPASLSLRPSAFERLSHLLGGDSETEYESDAETEMADTGSLPPTPLIGAVSNGALSPMSTASTRMASPALSRVRGQRSRSSSSPPAVINSTLLQPVMQPPPSQGNLQPQGTPIPLASPKPQRSSSLVPKPLALAANVTQFARSESEPCPLTMSKGALRNASPAHSFGSLDDGSESQDLDDFSYDDEWMRPPARKPSASDILSNRRATPRSRSVRTRSTSAAPAVECLEFSALQRSSHGAPPAGTTVANLVCQEVRSSLESGTMEAIAAVVETTKDAKKVARARAHSLTVSRNRECRENLQALPEDRPAPNTSGTMYALLARRGDPTRTGGSTSAPGTPKRNRATSTTRNTANDTVV
eukprot:m.7959 g.7959  ORF g.7959 m.7959 type:complete len:1055 (-) comp2812_c0_seq1:53-3217(-)